MMQARDRWTRGAARWAAALLLLLGGGGALAAQEVATVEVDAQPVITVAASGGELVTERARAIEAVIEELIDARQQALAPIDVAAAGDSGTVVRVAGRRLVLVTPSDAEVATGAPVAPEEVRSATRRVAREWAEATREKAWVVVQGNPLFPVGGTAELRAARRAAAIGVQIAELAGREGPLPEIGVQARGEEAVVVAGIDPLATVTADEARARGVRPERLAQEWATGIRRAVEIIRQQRSGTYTLLVVAYSLLAVLVAATVHLALRAVSRRVKLRLSPDVTRRKRGLVAVLALWGISVLQFLLWLALAAYVVWLIPSTRPIAFAAGARALRALSLVTRWLLAEGVMVALILVATIFFARFAGALVSHLILAFGARQGGRTGLRAETLAGTASGATQLVVGFIGLVAVLGYQEVNPLPLLASAGVVGIALGFGVQTLIRDFFTGMFILLEDQYGVGDVIRVQQVSGVVERFTLRITQVRSMDGSLTSIPNGVITTVTNLSKDYGQVVLDVNIALGEDVDRATQVIERTARILAGEWKERIVGDPEVLGVETVDPLAQAVSIRVLLRTDPKERWNAARELRRRILDAFRDEEIQVPPRAVVTLPRQPTPGP